MSDRCRPWYADGLPFSCTQCGKCCRVEGHVWVDPAEIRTIARHLGLDLDTFGRRFLRRIGERLSLIDKQGHDCIFWDNGCSIYAVRPRQCRTFPFWDSHLENPATWKVVAGECEGIGQGLLYHPEEISSLRRGHGATMAEPTNEDGTE